MLGIGNGELGIGHWALGIVNSEELGIRSTSTSLTVSYVELLSNLIELEVSS